MGKLALITGATSGIGRHTPNAWPPTATTWWSWAGADNDWRRLPTPTAK
jgi:hypothetical protein